MLFHVEMTVHIPHDVDRAKLEALRVEEKERAQELQRRGIWLHLWRVVGEYRNFSVFRVDSNDELHELLSALPLFPFMRIRTTPICRHPSSIHARDHD